MVDLSLSQRCSLVTVEVIAEPAADAGTHPAPTGDAILQVEGVPNQGTIALDARALMAFGTWGYTVTDPWLNARVRYTGVLLASLLERLGAPANATVEAIASDGYRFSIPARGYVRWPVLPATDSNTGSLGDKGPVRIIFPYDAHDDVQAARNMVGLGARAADRAVSSGDSMRNC